MSGHGGRRTGSGRKRIYTSQKHCLQVWQRGHRRISLDYIIYYSWEASKIKCGYKTDSQFAGHLLSLERRRRQNEPAVSTKRKTRSHGEDGPTPAKRSRHLEGPPVTSTPVKPVPVSIESPNLTVESIIDTSDVDVTGITEFSVNDSTYHIAGDSVIITSDGDKYQDSDESISDYQSSDEEDIVDRSINLVLMDALHDLHEDSHHAGDSDSLSISDDSDINDMENSVHMEENDYENELQAQTLLLRLKGWRLGTNKAKTNMASTGEQVVKKSKTSFRLYLEGIYDWVLMPPYSKAAIYWLVVLAGSFIHEFLPLPQSYLSNKRNVFNVYFVKLGWGWTLGLLIPFISLTSSVYTSFNPTAMLKHLSRMAVGTFGWYFWVNLFVYIEELTGQCEGEETLYSKKSCRLQGFHWDGFDISGHAFLLIYSALLISEEIQVKRWWSTTQRNQRGTTVFDRISPLVDLLFICISFLLVLWEFMLVCTTVYFHTVHQKVLGALIALFTWYVTYGIWYENEQSPGRPWIPLS